MSDFKIGIQLKERCKVLGIEQDEVAEQVGCNKATITRDFKGQNTPHERIEAIVSLLYSKVREREMRKKEWMKEIDLLFNNHKSAKRIRKALNRVKRRCICRVFLPTEFKIDFVDGEARIKAASFMLTAKKNISKSGVFYSNIPCVAVYDKSARKDIYVFRIVPGVGISYVIVDTVSRLREITDGDALHLFRSFARGKGFGTDGMLGLLQLAKECVLADENLNENAYKKGCNVLISEANLRKWLEAINMLMNKKKRKQLGEALSSLQIAQAEMFAALRNAESASLIKEKLIDEINKIQSRLYPDL